MVKEKMAKTENPDYENKFVDVWGILPSIRIAIKSNMNIMLRGPTGTGKTYMVNELAEEHKKTLLVMNMTAGHDTESIKGRHILIPGEGGKLTPKWVDGIVVTAMKKGHWLIIEEANFMPEELASIFYSIMDDRKNVVIEEHENEVVKAHPEFRIFLTANWGYKGTVIPNDAIRARIDTYYDLSYLPENEEAKLIVRETGIDLKIAKLISKFAWRQRKIKSKHMPDISTRTLIRWATLINNGLEPLEAGERTIISLMFHDEKEKEKIREALEFEFEALDVKKKPKEKTEEVYEMKKEGEKVKFKRTRKKTKAGDVEVDDIVKVEHSGMTFYGKVSKITSSKDGYKIWAIWNEELDKAKKGIPSEVIPTESAEYLDRVEKVE